MNAPTLARSVLVGCLAAAMLLPLAAGCSTTKPAAAYDAEIARAAGADEHGMRKYVFVLLKTGPKKMPKGAASDEMFKGHFANMKRLAAEGKLILAGPFDGADGWRGMFIFAVDSIDEAKACVATDPVIISGEMVAEYHIYVRHRGAHVDERRAGASHADADVTMDESDRASHA